MLMLGVGVPSPFPPRSPMCPCLPSPAFSCYPAVGSPARGAGAGLEPPALLTHFPNNWCGAPSLPPSQESPDRRGDRACPPRQDWHVCCAGPWSTPLRAYKWGPTVTLAMEAENGSLWLRLWYWEPAAGPQPCGSS